MRKRLWHWGVYWQWGEGKRQACLRLLAWGSDRELMPSVESVKGRDTRERYVLGSSGDRRGGTDRGGLEDSGGAGQARGDQPRMGRHPGAGNSRSHHPEPQGAKGENSTEPPNESMVAGRARSVSAPPGAYRKIPFSTCPSVSCQCLP